MNWRRHGELGRFVYYHLHIDGIVEFHFVLHDVASVDGEVYVFHSWVEIMGGHTSQV